MNTPTRSRLRSGFPGARLAVPLAILGLAVASLMAVVGSRTPAEGASEKVHLEQCANLGTTCDSSHSSQWQNGNLGTSQAKYFEGDSVPYRSVIDRLTPGQTYAVSIEWDSTKNGKHAHDYLTTFNRTETTADLCSGSVCSGSPQLLAIPPDPNVTGAGVTPLSGQKFHLYGGTFVAPGAVIPNTGNLCGTASCTIATNPSAYSLVNTYADSSQTRLTVYVTAVDTQIVLGWAGHISTRVDWGLGGSAVAISGSPYHMNIHDFTCSDDTNCSVGNMDRSLDANAVVFSSAITVIKAATPESSASFSFGASPSPLSNFSLVDDGTSTDRTTISGIVDFTTYTIAEELKSGWDFGSASCVIQAPFGGSYLVSGRTVTIDLREGEIVTCTFTNSESTTTTTTSTTTTTPETTTTVPATTTTAAATTTSAPAATSTSTTVMPEITTTTSPGLPAILPGTGSGRGKDFLSLTALILLAAGAGASLVANARVRGRKFREWN